MGAGLSIQRMDRSVSNNMSRSERGCGGGLQPMKRARTGSKNFGDEQAASKLIKAHDEDIDIRANEFPHMGLRVRSASSRGDYPNQFLKTDAVASAEEYWREREQMVRREDALSFDFQCKAQATELEKRVDRIIRKLRERDIAEVYSKAQPRRGYGGQYHPRFEGDHFLSNVGLINETRLFKVASRMPKGAHLHIHFNSCLPPNILLDIAKDMRRMFITSDLPLIPDGNYENYDKCEIQFSILSPEKENPGDLFSSAYQPRQTMQFGHFLKHFPRHYLYSDADVWLMRKLIFEEKEAHGSLQTTSGVWEKFNGRTRMMKGLFNYERAYRKYTHQCLKDFDRDGIQYAEIRPNFMMSNQLLTDDGTSTIDNEGIMRIIIDEVTSYKKEHASESRFHGLKVIYCTPRVFNPAAIQAALNECLKFKQRWPDWIAGFDLVGEEAKGNPIRAFIPQLLDFKRKCKDAGLDIPFLFHCGETLDVGTDTDGNLVDALLLGSKRIGHGFALPRHPYIMQQMKARNICVELCPISNEILGLTPRINGHAMYELLANGVHCAVSSDNGALFRSSLSHDFYQVLVGKADMGLCGWKQLILWSLEHACLGEKEKTDVMDKWRDLWRKFLEEVDKKYGEVLGGANETHL